MNVSYSREQCCEALRVYRRTGSVTKTILLLGYPGCLSLHESPGGFVLVVLIDANRC